MNQTLSRSLAALCAPMLLLACSGATATQAPAQSPTPQVASSTAGLDAFRQPRENLWTGGRPSDADLDAFAATPGGLVISLLSADELGDEAERVAARNLGFLLIPITGAVDLTEDNARKLGEALRNHEGQPVLLHCGSGNRAGALLAMEAFYVRGENVEAAIALGKNAGLTSLESAVREHLTPR